MIDDEESTEVLTDDGEKLLIGTTSGDKYPIEVLVTEEGGHSNTLYFTLDQAHFLATELTRRVTDEKVRRAELERSKGK